jgi:hypothetical protein
MSLLDALLLDPYRINVWIAYRTDGVKGTGTQADPWDGSTASKLDAALNDALVTANARIHFGPGIFLINGYQDGSATSWLKAGMQIVGSGIDVTTLRLVGATTAGKHYFAIGHPFMSGGQPNPMDGVEVSNLTIDCNLAGASSQIACGAVRLMGSHCRARRLKVINWGTKTSGPGCFVIAMITADPASGVAGVTDTGIEECIAIQPVDHPTNVGPVTVLRVGPKDDAGTDNEGFGTGPFIRNCFVDCGSPTATPEYRGISMSWCKGGIVEGNQVYNTKYGGPYGSLSSAREMVVRSNLYKNIVKGPFWTLATLSPTGLQSLQRDLTGDPTGKTAIATTSSTHYLLAGDRVKVDASSAPANYKGVFVVKDVPASNQFRYVMVANPGSGSVTGPTKQKIFGVAKLVVEENTIELATGSTGLIGVHLDDASLSPQAPDYAHGDVLIRDNRIRYLDGAFDSTYAGYAVQANGAKNLIVRTNVVDCAPGNPIRNNRCGSVQYFDDRTPAGILIRGIDEGNANKKYDELQTDAEDAFILGMLNKK